MNISGSYISMPVVRAESDRNEDDQSKKEKERQLERQLPRMRIAEKNRSEKMLANAMQVGETKKSVQEFSMLPRPATIKNKSNEDGLDYPTSKDGLHHLPVRMQDNSSDRLSSKDGLHHHPARNDDLSHTKEINSPDLTELHALEELLYQREKPPSLSDVLTILKNTEKNLKNDREFEIKSKQHAADQDDMLCSLDFLGGYVSASNEMPIIRAEIMGVIESLRQHVTNRPVDTGTTIALQQENLVQLLGDSETQYSVQKDALGRQKLVFEVSESMMSKIVSSPRRPETKDTAVNPNAKPGDDSLPLVVQRSV